MVSALPMHRTLLLFGLLGLWFSACGGHALSVRDAGGKPPDAKEDADAGSDTGPDAMAEEETGADVGPDTGLDAAAEGRADGSVDLGPDGSDAIIDLGQGAGGLDAGVTLLAAVLPSPRHEPAVFSDGQAVYVAGGLDDKSTLLAQIVRFTPSTGTLAVLPEVLPAPTYATGVAWTGLAAYLVGGLDRNGALRQIVRYVPATGTATIVSAQMPVAAYNVGAVWVGNAVYIFGGVAGTHLTQILKYDPAADVLSTLVATLPVGIEAPAVFWDGSRVWILGGKTDAAGATGAASNAVQIFDPASSQASLLGSLPYAAWDVPAFSDGKVVYLPGGAATSTTGYTSILRFDPVAQATSTLIFSLPTHASGRVGAWVSSVRAGYLCGGADYATGKPTDKIIQVVP